jgi:hypothetical protein
MREVPAATAAGTGWPPRPDGPTPGETGASPDGPGVPAGEAAVPAAAWSAALGIAPPEALIGTVVGTLSPEA